MKILLVEDEQKLAKAIKAGLKREGFAVDLIMDGESAQRRIEICRNDYDLVVLDLMLPKKDGFEVCKSVREQGITIPILILTAKGDTEDKIKLLNSGADDYLPKPFSFQELVARIKALLRRPQEKGGNPEVALGELKLNTSTREVFKGSRKIDLTLKEFSLLEYLMKHPNQVLNREQILDHIWDFDFDSFSNVIDVHVKNLRKKLNTGNKNDNILETIRGVGYRIRG